MPTAKKHDKIDAELSKTYFRTDSGKTASGGSRKSSAGTKRASNKRSPKASSPFKVLTAKLVLPVVLILALAAGLFLIISSRNGAKAPVSSGSALSYDMKPSYQLSEGKILYDFEKDEDGWEVPAWAFDKNDYVASRAARSSSAASSGKNSLEVVSDFPGGLWTASLVEIQHYLDLSKYTGISADILLPPGSPTGLRAKIIITVGDSWRFVEMSRSVPLVPGEWTLISAKLSEDSTDWKRTVVDKAFKEDVRKIAIRIESNRKPAYSGPLYIDNVRVY